MKEFSNTPEIGIKRMGELNTQPFYEAMKKKYRNEAEAEERASELCSLWEEYLKDPDWHPVRVIEVDGKHKVCPVFEAYLSCDVVNNVSEFI